MAQLMNTIAGTYERCQSEGVGISRNLIRELALSGTIPTVLVGKNTRLINFDVLMNFLNTGTPEKKPEYNASDIRRIEVR